MRDLILVWKHFKIQGCKVILLIHHPHPPAPTTATLIPHPPLAHSVHEGDAEEAQRALDRALALDLESGWAYLLQAELAQEGGDAEEAAEALHQVAAEDGDPARGRKRGRGEGGGDIPRREAPVFF